VSAQIARVLRPGGNWFVCELHPDRQPAGKQARFTGADGREVRVDAWPHDVGDYLNAAIEAGLEPLRMDEWRDPGDPNGIPRLLSLRGRLRPPA
jgi:hypothetical protein